MNNIKWENIRIEHVGQKTIIELLKILTSNSNIDDKNIAYRSLLKIGGELVETCLEKYLIKRISYSQNELLLKLLKQFNRDNNLLILFQLKHPDFIKRAVAVEKIGKLKLKSYLSGVINLIEDHDPSVRFAVCKTLEKFLIDDDIKLDESIKNDIYSNLKKRIDKENISVIRRSIQRLIPN